MFLEHAQRDQRVHQHAGRARIGVDHSRNLLRCGSLANRSKKIQFDRRQQNAALLKCADSLSKLFR